MNSSNLKNDDLEDAEFLFQGARIFRFQPFIFRGVDGGSNGIFVSPLLGEMIQVVYS